MEPPEGPSDAELIARVRNGDLEAYGELYGRHHQAAERMARQLVPANDADDLASDAFAKVLDALRAGGGPDVSFRAYLLTTVRRVHVDRIRSGRRVTATDDIAAYEREPETFDDPTVTGFESGAAAKAFASLPERWQAVLWHTEVEGEKPATIAPLLGLSANGVSALAYRAREGLRQAYLQQHLADVAGDRCRWTNERLGAYVRGGLTKRENRNVREHLDDCAKCTAVYLELVEVNSALPALLAPALLGTAGLGYLAATSGAKVGLVGFFAAGWKKVTENGTRTAVGAGAAAVVAVAVALVAMALSSDQTPPAAVSEPPGLQPTQPTGSAPSEPPVKPPPTKPTNAPTTVPTQPVATATRTPDPTTPSPPSRTSPASPQPEATTPILDEGLLTISMPAGGGGPSDRAEGSRATGVRYVLTIKAPPGNTKPVVVSLKYGAVLGWPLNGNPSGWTCTALRRTCTAINRAAPAPMPITFDAPTSGADAARRFTVSAKAGRYYDDDSATVAAVPSTDENLLTILDGLADSEIHHRILVVAPGTDRPSVTLKITYGSTLEWPIASNPAGWRCSAKTQTCTALNPAKPAPLPADFDVQEDGSVDARTFTVTAKAGLVSDTDSEVLPELQQHESLLQIVTPTAGQDPNPLAYNRFLKVNGVGGRRVTLDISWGRNLSLMPSVDASWTCSQSSGIRRATCSTDKYKKPLDSEWNAWLPGSGSDNAVTVNARVGGRVDTDTALITLTTPRR